MLDHLQTHDRIDVAERQGGEVGLHVRQGVRRCAVRDRGPVVVNGDHLGARLLEDPGAVALA
jgi:hypothetical protein